LYKSNEYAREFIRLLRDGSTRVKASVGGIIPKVLGNEVVSVLWNNLALTTAPVNPTVGPAVALSKALSGAEFVKALSAGCGTDSAEFSGGRALQKEDAACMPVEHEKDGLPVSCEEAVESLVGAVTDGDVEDMEEAEKFLNGFGISKAAARDVIRGVVEKSKEIQEVLPMAKGKLWDEVTERLKKSFGKPGEDGGVGPDKLDQGKKGKKEEEEEGDGGGGEIEEIEDAAPVMKALMEKVSGLSETVEMMAKSQAALIEQIARGEEMQKSMGEGLLAIMERTEQIARTPEPRKGAVTALEAAMAKAGIPGAGLGGGTAGGAIRHRQFTPEAKDAAMGVLLKAVNDGEITSFECGRIETQINKSLRNPAFQLDQKYARLIESKLKE
jgi:hypothetical protein